MSQNPTVLPRRMAQPVLRRETQDSSKGATTQQIAALRAKVATLSTYVEAQREMIDRMWDRLVRSISEHHGAGPLVNRPTPGILNRTYLVTDAAPNLLLSIDDGTVWRDIILP
jgi:hypothetical protein